MDDEHKSTRLYNRKTKTWGNEEQTIHGVQIVIEQYYDEITEEEVFLEIL